MPGLEPAVRPQHARRRAVDPAPRTASSDPGTSVRADYGSNDRAAGRVRERRPAATTAALVRHRQPASRRTAGATTRRRDAASCSARSAGATATTDVALTAALRRHRPDRQRPAGAALPRSATTPASTPSPTTRKNRSCLLNLALDAEPRRAAVALAATPTTATSRPRTFNGDINDDSLDRGALPAQRRRARGARPRPATPAFRPRGENAGQHAVPVLALHRQRPAQHRAEREVQRPDQPHAHRPEQRRRWRRSSTSTATLGRSRATSSPSARRRHQSHAHFTQSSQFGYLTPDRGVVTVDGPAPSPTAHAGFGRDAFDARVDLTGRTQTCSVYATRHARRRARRCT